jgi:hypothetical protein
MYKVSVSRIYDANGTSLSWSIGTVIAQVVGWAKPDPTTRQVLQLGNPTPNVTSM